MLEPLDLRDVRVSVDEGVAVGKPRREPRLAAGGRAGDVQHPDPSLPHLDDPLDRQRALELGVVHVPADRLDRRAECPQLVERRSGDDVAPVEDQVGGAQSRQTSLGEPPGSPR